MKWIWRRFSDEPGAPENTVDLSEEKAAARDALRRSSQALAAANAKTPEVNRLSRSLREIRRKNHFIELLDLKGTST